MEIRNDERKEFKYIDDLLIEEICYHLLNKDSTKWEYLYKDNLLIKSTFYRNQIQLKILNYSYNKALLIKVDEISTYKNKEFVAFSTIYSYEIDVLSKVEEFGRLDSQLVLFRMKEFLKVGDILTEKESKIDYSEYYLGYYDMEALIESDPSGSVTIACIDIFKTFDSIEVRSKKYNFFGEVIFIETKSSRPKEKYFCWGIIHIEFNETHQKEFEIGFEINSEISSQLNYIIKYYYQ